MSYTTNSAMGGLGRIYDGVQSLAAGAPFPIVQMAVFDTIEDFCRRSLIWREEISWTMPKFVASVDLSPVDTQTLVLAVLRVRGLYNYRIRPPALLVDFGDLKQARSGNALVACKPTVLNEYGMPSEIVDEWSEAIRGGALFRLMMMPGKPWSDAKLASYYGRLFTMGWVSAKAQSRTNGDLPDARFPYFARGAQRGYGNSSSFSTIAPTDPPSDAQGNPLVYPIPINDADSDVDGGTFADNPEFGDFDGGTY